MASSSGHSSGGHSSSGHSAGRTRSSGHAGSGGGHSSGSHGRGGAGGPAQVNSPMCPAFIGARVARLTRLNACGAPLFGYGNVVTSIGIVTVTFEPDVQQGKALDTTNLNGEICVSGSTPDSFNGIKVSIEFCQVDPAVFSIMQPGWKIVRNTRDNTGRPVGFRIGQNISDEFAFSLELWPKTLGQVGSACTAFMGQEAQPDPSDVHGTYGYFLLPHITAKAPDQWEIKGDEVATFKLNGQTTGGSAWDVGPYAVTRDEAGHPSPLLRPIEDGSGKSGYLSPVTGQPMTDPDHFHAEIVSVSPPSPVCGPQNLIRPQIEVHTSGNQAQVTLLNADQVAPPDPRTGARPPVWVSWGDGSWRTNLTAGQASHAPTHQTGGQQQIPTQRGHEQSQRENPVEVTPNPHDPHMFTVTARQFPNQQPITVNWGAPVEEVMQ